MEIRPPHSMSVRQTVRHAQLTFQSPVGDKEETYNNEFLLAVNKNIFHFFH